MNTCCFTVGGGEGVKFDHVQIEVKQKRARHNATKHLKNIVITLVSSNCSLLGSLLGTQLY